MVKEVECIRDSLPNEVNLNTTAKNEHVSHIERKSRVIKECTRALIRTLALKMIPGRITI